MPIYSLQIEKYVLSGLVKHSDSYADIESFISENDLSMRFIILFIAYSEKHLIKESRLIKF